MTSTYVNAIDEMFGLIVEAWPIGSAAIINYVPELRWPGVEEISAPNSSEFWARASQQTVLERQVTFRDGEVTRYRTNGLVFVQLFCPRSLAQSMEMGRELAAFTRGIFRGKETVSGIWFRNARVNELTPDKSSYRFNVVAEYEYDELG